ncbi:17755_t:CDS:2, partial [Funneliformis geosporum]
TQQKYGRAQGICHRFILDKQRSQEIEIEIEDVANIKNPIITT